ncbi:hypothetical protein ACJIZ3_007009 [Penstemon smallii]|uniref:Myb-like domain-containing protein n=1 Tax=Penstemon smallii TaxID=265156 RepID=A0ABD3S9B6_9LAMI
MDLLDDIFADEPVKNARVVGKFQPKSKFRPSRKEPSATSVQISDTAKNDISEPVRTAKPSEHDDQRNSESVSLVCENDPTKDIPKATIGLHSNIDAVPNKNGDWHASIEKSVGENADMFIELEALSDSLPHTTTDMEGTGPASEAAALTTPDPENAQEGPPIPVFSSVEGPTHTCDVANSPTRSRLTEDSDLLTAEEPISSRSEGVVCMDNLQMEREEMDVMDSINISEFATKSVRRTGKFQPKPKLKTQKKTYVARSVSNELGSQPDPPGISSAEPDSVPAFQHDDVLDLSSIGFPHSEPVEATSEFSLNEESINLMEMPQLDSDLNLDGVPDVPAKLASRRAKAGRSGAHTASDPSLQACTLSSENGTGRCLRPRKRKSSSREQVDEAEDEVLTNREFSDEPPGSSFVEEENINNEESQVESEPKVKKVRRKSKKTDDDKEKPDKKRKKAKEASDHGADVKPKFFSHSTRRRRVVDKVLLETPEDELDYRNVPLRDLILLREHKERQTKKEEAAAREPAVNPSNGNSSAPHNEDETFMSRQGGEFDEEQETPVIDESNIYFNYQTYMDKTPIKRWSKQDTAKFYEALRQFGTDFSLIQQLFPDCDRRQLKLKFKKEEKKHPLMLREALTNRGSSSDNSLFSKVIERLRQIAAEEKENAEKEESIDLTGDEAVEEETLNVDDEEGKKEENIEKEEKDNLNTHDSVEEAQSPVEEAYDSEEDLYDWSQYKSDT